jgi:hypothetical protein
VRAQLALGCPWERIGSTVMQAEPNLVTNSKVKLAVMTIIVQLGVLLGLQQARPHIREEEITVLKLRINSQSS